MDPDTCPTDATTKCRPPVQPYKKYNYKDIKTGNWKCKNPKTDNVPTYFINFYNHILGIRYEKARTGISAGNDLHAEMQ